jgi:crotonobetainyl-CoA:carnitine CoA-transferase CaiB-like acyl-CoA transferase
MRPLEGITVVDLTIALAGPYATQLLGALGATVIKVENPASGDSARGNPPYVGAGGIGAARREDGDMSVSMLERGRGKLGITLALKHPGAGEVLADLFRIADVVVENFSAGTADRLGAGYRVASEVNPEVVYTSISGFGQDGGGRGFDAIFQALSGFMATAGSESDAPVRSNLPLGDLAGPLFAVIGTVSALLMRERTGRGQHVDVSLLGALTSVVATEPWLAMERAGIGSRTGNVAPRLAPFGVFETADGHVALCAPTDAFAAGVFEALGRGDLADDPRFSSRDARVVHATELHALVCAWAAEHTTADALAALEAAGVPTAPVRTTAEAIADPRALARGETVPLAHPDLGQVEGLYGSGLPIRFSHADAGYTSAAPRLGEHTEFVLGGLLGYDRERIDALRARGVI